MVISKASIEGCLAFLTVFAGAMRNPGESTAFLGCLISLFRRKMEKWYKDKDQWVDQHERYGQPAGRVGIKDRMSCRIFWRGIGQMVHVSAFGSLDRERHPESPPP